MKNLISASMVTIGLLCLGFQGFNWYFVSISFFGLLFIEYTPKKVYDLRYRKIESEIKRNENCRCGGEL